MQTGNRDWDQPGHPAIRVVTGAQEEADAYLKIWTTFGRRLSAACDIATSYEHPVQNCTFCDDRALITSLQIVTGLDPQLCPREKRPCGLTDLVPLPASPAIGRGNPEVCGGALVGGVDRSGRARPASCTLGAYESAPLASTGCQVTAHAQPPGAAGLALLAVALVRGLGRRRRALAKVAHR